MATRKQSVVLLALLAFIIVVRIVSHATAARAPPAGIVLPPTGGWPEIARRRPDPNPHDILGPTITTPPISIAVPIQHVAPTEPKVTPHVVPHTPPVVVIRTPPIARNDGEHGAPGPVIQDYLRKKLQQQNRIIVNKQPFINSQPPVESGMTTEQWIKKYENVTIIWTWVNSSDPLDVAIHQKLGREAGTEFGWKCLEDRQLRYALRAYDEYMSWHKGTVYLITPGYWPYWLNRSHPRLKLLHQNEIMWPDKEAGKYNLQQASEPPLWWDFDTVLNSNSVESSFENLERWGLTEQFIHMNDDYMFGANVFPWHFFTKNGVWTFMGPTTIPWTLDSLGESRYRAVWRASTALTWDLLDTEYKLSRTVHWKLKHSPFIYYKTALKKIKQKWKPYFDDVLTHPFRNYSDIITPLLHHNWLLYDAQAKKLGLYGTLPPKTLFNTDHFYITYKMGDKALHTQLQNIERVRPHFFTINGGCVDSQTARMFQNWLNAFYDKPSSFELRGFTEELKDPMLGLSANL